MLSYKSVQSLQIEEIKNGKNIDLLRFKIM